MITTTIIKEVVKQAQSKATMTTQALSIDRIRLQGLQPSASSSASPTSDINLETNWTWVANPHKDSKCQSETHVEFQAGIPPKTCPSWAHPSPTSCQYFTPCVDFHVTSADWLHRCQKVTSTSIQTLSSLYVLFKQQENAKRVLELLSLHFRSDCNEIPFRMKHFLKSMLE